jgi:hemerythrin superfamily protein
MDPFELLKKDHEKVASLFEEIEAASGDAKKNIFSQIKSELDLHSEIEETIFYPALENKAETKDITLEAYEEHKVVKDLLAELADGRASEEWDAKLKVLKENVEHHVEEEEGELFDKAQDALSEDQLEQLGDEMAAAKGTAQPEAESATKRASKKTPAKKAAKKSRKTGILGTLASFVGVGSGKKRTARKSAAKKRGTKKAASKKSPAKRAAKKTSKKRTATTKKAGRRTSASGRSTLKVSRKKTSRGSKSRKRTSSRKR